MSGNRIAWMSSVSSAEESHGIALGTMLGSMEAHTRSFRLPTS